MGLTPQRTRDQLMRRTSPRLGTPGQCLARTAFAAWSVSQCQTTVPPVACSTARSSMPLPENMEPIRMLHFATLRRRPHRSYLASESRGSWIRLYRTKQVRKTGVSIRAACSRLMGWNTTQTIISHHPSFVNTYDIWRVVDILMVYVLCPPLSYVLLEKQDRNRRTFGGVAPVCLSFLIGLHDCIFINS